jgi:sterol desaturase/sphingolipid hydroxylase (fatty acid hydroxylase superfamily)
MNANYALLIIFILLLVWEYKLPRQAGIKADIRWPANFGLTFLTLTIHYFVIIIVDDIAVIEFSLLPLSTLLPYPLYVISAIIILDLLMYLIHRISHRYLVLWHLHKVHHSDPEIDISTNFRHHPLEYLWGGITLYLFMCLFDIDVYTLVLYSFCAQVIQLWHHSNIHLPATIDKQLAKVFITPKVHLVHHSMVVKESHSNFGTIFSCWDRIFSTFHDPVLTPDIEKFGIANFSDEANQSLKSLLIQPFKK